MPRLRAVHLLLEAREFYDHHRAHRDPFYTDRVIHSPAVPVFRDDRGRLLDEPYTAGFLTAAARRTPAWSQPQHRSSAHRTPGAPSPPAPRRVLETAAACGYRRLVLGAWGCGVFRTTPRRWRARSGPCSPGRPLRRHFEHVVVRRSWTVRAARSTLRSAFRSTFAASGSEPVRAGQLQP